MNTTTSPLPFRAFFAALALCASGCLSAQQQHNEDWVRRQAVQVRPVDTSGAVTLGFGGPTDTLQASLAAAMVRSMRNEKLDASVLAPGERASAGIVIEPRLVLLDAGGQGRGAVGIPGVRVAMEGRSLASDGRLLGEFHAADSSRAVRRAAEQP